MENPVTFEEALLDLASPSPPARSIAATYMQILYQHVVEQNLDDLLEALRIGLVTLDVPELLTGLTQALFDEQGLVRYWSAFAIRKFGPLHPELVRGPLAKALGNNPSLPNQVEHERFQIMYAMLTLGPDAAPEAVEPLADLIEKAIPEIRGLEFSFDSPRTLADDANYAALVLIYIGPVANNPKIIYILTQDYYARAKLINGQVRSGEALAKIGKEGVAALLEFLFDPKIGIRRNTATALAQAWTECGEQVAVTLSQIILNEPDALRRQRAIEGLGRVGGSVVKTVIPILSQALAQESDHKLRRLIIWALESSTDKDSDTIELIAKLNDEQRKAELAQQAPPVATQQLITQYRELLVERAKTGQLPILTQSELHKLYLSFGPSRLELPTKARHGENYDRNEAERYKIYRLTQLKLADYVLAKLGLLTVEKVQPIWEDWNWDTLEYPGDEAQEVERVLQCVRNLLVDPNSAKQAFFLSCEDFNFDFNLANSLPYPVFSVFDAASDLLDKVLSGDADEIEEYFTSINTETSPDSNHLSFPGYTRATSSDFANLAACAYSVTDLAPPRSWPDYLDDYDNDKPKSNLQINRDKMLEFWHWWLDEALPQAWQQGLDSLNNP